MFQLHPMRALAAEHMALAFSTVVREKEGMSIARFNEMRECSGFI